MNGDPEILFYIFKVSFYQSVFHEKNFLGNISKKVGFWGNYPLIFTFLVRAMTPKIIFKNFDFICDEYLELQKKI